MKAQNFENHTRYYPLHHFILTPLTLIYLGFTIYHINDHPSNSQAWLSILLAVIIVLLPLLARIYA